jgi:pantoate--beta-alanine ligase
VARSGGRDAKIIAEGKKTLEAAGFRVDYLDVRDAETLKPADANSARPLRALAAAWLGKTRLIDNVAV